MPNAQGAAIFERYLWQDTEFEDENGTVVLCGSPTTYHWSLSRSGPNPGVIISGVLVGTISTDLADFFDPAPRSTRKLAPTT